VQAKVRGGSPGEEVKLRGVGFERGVEQPVMFGLHSVIQR